MGCCISAGCSGVVALPPTGKPRECGCPAWGLPPRVVIPLPLRRGRSSHLPRQRPVRLPSCDHQAPKAAGRSPQDPFQPLPGPCATPSRPNCAFLAHSPGTHQSGAEGRAASSTQSSSSCRRPGHRCLNGAGCRKKGGGSGVVEGSEEGRRARRAHALLCYLRTACVQGGGAEAAPGSGCLREEARMNDSPPELAST
jgi:hypothetical protein